LGDSDFVEKVLSQASEQMARRYRLKAERWTLTKITESVAELAKITVAHPLKIRIVSCKGLINMGSLGSGQSNNLE